MQTEVAQTQPLEVREQNPDGTWFYRKRYLVTRTYQTNEGQPVTVSRWEVKKVPCSGPTNQKRGRKPRPISDETRHQIIELRQSGLLNDAIMRQTGTTRAQVMRVLTEHTAAELGITIDA